MTVTVTIIVIAVLICLSAFFSASETALTAASKPLLHEMERDGTPGAARVNRLLKRRERLIGTILLGNNLVNILASALATGLFIGVFGETGIAYATAIMTVTVLVLGEILPKTFALLHTTGTALRVAPVMAVLVWVLRPVSMLLQGVVSMILVVLDWGKRTPTSSAEALSELRGAIDLHTREKPGLSGQAERHMLRSILDLTDVPVSDIMIHRSRVRSIDVDLPVAEIVRDVLSSPFSRIPLWRDRPENIVGVLNNRSLSRALQDHEGDTTKINILKIASPPWFIPDTTPLLRQLSAFRQRRGHFAIVIDEYGSLKGVVTLEDILEEIVGDILDEYDVAVPGVRPQTDGSFLINGDVTIRDLNREFDWTLPDEDAATIAGLLIRESRTIPKDGQQFRFYGFTFEVVRRHGNRLMLLRLTPPSRQGALR